MRSPGWKTMVLIACVMLLCACNNPLSIIPNPFGDDDGDRLAMRTLLRTGGPFGAARFQQVIEGEAAWLAFWVELAQSAGAPPVDFATEIVVLVGMETGNACFDIEITEARRLDDDVRLSVRESRPTSSCACAEIAWAPLHIVAITRTALPVIFDIEQVRECD